MNPELPNRSQILNECLTALGLVLEFDLNDHPTHQHAMRVGECCVIIGDKLGLPPKNIQQLYFAGLIHDIGKIGIDINILRKKGSLTAEEYQIVKQHSITGARIAAAIPELSDLSFWIRWHHEKWDGTGYPDKLSGDEIPVEVQILSAVDCFDSLQTPRLDRDKYSLDEAVKIISDQSGEAFNPEIVNLLCEMIKNDEFEPDKTSDRFLQLEQKYLKIDFHSGSDNYWEGFGMAGLYPILRLFARVIDAKHGYTHGHSTRVSILSKFIAEKAGFSTSDIIKAEVAGLLHDAGKISIPHEILDKKHDPDSREWELIRNHPIHSYHILNKISSMGEIATITRQHHERLDGSGYPAGISGDEIDILAQIIAISDTFDAITSERSYRKQASFDNAYREIKNGLGTLYNRELGTILLNTHPSYIKALFDNHRN
ncbi:MAG TPA: HD domain-containing protein [Spirochaetota bacterium]|nr:HD domain-containing protein [Spirochaetota bacterium]HPJ35566.1 HD domain-containing protein [Spirochaetota bacterium]